MRIYFLKKVAEIVAQPVKNLAIQHPPLLLVLLVPIRVVVDVREHVVDGALVLQPRLLVLLVIILVRAGVIVLVVEDARGHLPHLLVPIALILVKADVIALVVADVRALQNLHLVHPALVHVVAIVMKHVLGDAMKPALEIVQLVVILAVMKGAILGVKVHVHLVLALVQEDVWGHVLQDVVMSVEVLVKELALDGVNI